MHIMKNTNLIWTLAFLVIIISFAMIGIHWNDLPDKVPMHFNLQGEANRFGGKGELFVLPVMSLGMWALFRWISKGALKINPNKYGAKTPAQLAVSKRFMAETTLFVCILLAIGVYSIMAVATGKTNAVNYMMAFTGIGLIALFIAYFVRLKNADKTEG